MDGRSAPQPGTGRPQYASDWNERRLVAATSSRQATSLGQARQTDSRAASWQIYLLLGALWIVSALV